MARVKVTFYLEADDPDHRMGLTTDTWDRVLEATISLGGEDTDAELLEDED